MLYGWLVDEQTTIRQILKRLNAGPWLPRSGRHAWSPSTVHHILADPIYVGTAYANRYAYVPAAKPRAQRGPHTGEATCRRLRPREEWIPPPPPPPRGPRGAPAGGGAPPPGAGVCPRGFGGGAKRGVGANPPFSSPPNPPPHPRVVFLPP